MPMLDRTQTPLSLLLDHDLENVTTSTGAIDGDLTFLVGSRYECVRANLERARDVLCEVGILRPSVDHTKFVGVMHQLVQRCVRDQFLHILQNGKSISSKCGSPQNIINVVRQVLERHMHFLCALNTQREVAPCVEAWCAIVVPMTPHSANSHMLEIDEHALCLLENLGIFIRDLQGDAQYALTIHNRVYALVKDILAQNHPGIYGAMGNLVSTFVSLGRFDDAQELYQEVLVYPDIATSLNDLAVTYSQLGRQDDALKLLREVLELYKPGLPRDHTFIATAMCNMAKSMCDLGRRDDALHLQQDVLEFRKRVLPHDHPAIGMPMDDLATVFSALGRCDDALRTHQKALEFYKRVLPQDHPTIAASMSNLVLSSSALGRYDDALKLQQQVVEFRKRVLPQDHPDIATSMNQLALTLSYSGRCDDALQLQQDVLEFRKRILPQDHPDIAISINDLATIFSARVDMRMHC